MKDTLMRAAIRCASAAALIATLGAVHAAQVRVQVTATNLAPANSVTVAPVHVGLHGGVFDAFDLGAVAGDPIVSVAEGGSGSAWFPAFAAADPLAVLGTLLPAPLLPGASATGSFDIDTAVNPFFTFAAMVVPSNDFFAGNDSPTAYRLFDGAGNLQITSISVYARDLWDAGSEVFDPAAAAFVGNNDLRTPQNSVVALNFAELAAFNGLLTAAGYVFDSQLAAGTEVLRLDFSVSPVPEPASLAMMLAGLGGISLVARRRLRV